MTPPENRAFSDEDLKCLERVVDKESSLNYLYDSDGLVKALLARLEAAEKVVLYAIDAPSCRYCVDNAIKSHNNDCPFLKDLEAWRKSKGEGR